MLEFTQKVTKNAAEPGHSVTTTAEQEIFPDVSEDLNASVMLSGGSFLKFVRKQIVRRHDVEMARFALKCPHQ